VYSWIVLGDNPLDLRYSSKALTSALGLSNTTDPSRILFSAPLMEDNESIYG